MGEAIPEIELHRPEILEENSSLKRWKWLIKVLGKRKSWAPILELFQIETTIGLLYPKLDAHVSAQTNHLLKCPFNVHHNSGKLSLPIDDIEHFDTSKCLNIFDVLGNEGLALMEPYLRRFDTFCDKVIKDQVLN